MHNLLERFNNKYKIDAITDCWNWIGAIRGNSGYGCIVFEKKVQSAHRISYVLFNGEIPSGKLILHSCDNKKCVNPAHLSIGTHSKNAIEMHERSSSVSHNKDKIAAKIKSTMQKYKVHPSLSQYNKGCRCDGCKQKKNEAYRKNKISKTI